MRAAIAGVGVVLLLAGAAVAQSPSPAASQGIYSAAQSQRGAALYTERCASCHGPSMEGVDVAPPLVGTAFARNWTNKPVAELSVRIRTTMPFDTPGTLGLADTASLVAAILEANGYPAGADLPGSPSAQQAIMIDTLTK